MLSCLCSFVISQRTKSYCGEAFLRLLNSVKALSNALILVTNYYNAMGFTSDSSITTALQVASFLGIPANDPGLIRCSPANFDAKFKQFNTESTANLKAAVSLLLALLCLALLCPFQQPL